MLSEQNKEKLALLNTLFYYKYKDYSIDRLESSLLDLYQKNFLTDIFEIYFLERLIAIRTMED